MLKKSLQGLALLVSLVPAVHAGDWYPDRYRVISPENA